MSTSTTPTDAKPARTPVGAGMTPRRKAVIVGGGLAAAKTAEALRDKGYDGQVRVITAEPHLPYERPALSKGNLTKGGAAEGATTLSQEWYDSHDVEVLTGQRVESIDPNGFLDLPRGRRVPWDDLVLATGAEARRLDMPGAALEGIHHLRTLDDSDRLRRALAGGGDVVIVGGGWIGLEVAAAARFHGCAVTVLEQSALPLAHVFGPAFGQFLADLHTGHGVEIRPHAAVTGFRGDGHGAVAAVELADGSAVTAHLVVVGVGAVPTTALGAGLLAVDNGFVVDERLRTSLPNVYAVGDVANAWHPTLGRQVRVEHWDTALRQPAVAAAGIVGEHTAYDALPYFFSDQYDLGLEFVGLLTPGKTYDIVRRPGPTDREFVAFWRDGVRVVGAMAVNTWGLTSDLEALVRQRPDVSSSRLRDPDVPLADLTGRRLDPVPSVP